MDSLEDLVARVVTQFLTTNTLFTALDVSNEVRKSMSFAKHREIREQVRELYQTDMQTAGYGKSVIQVQLADGSQVDAVLYHHLSDSWDLDTKYDDQKRHQSLVMIKHGGSVPAQPVAPVVKDTKAVWDSFFGKKTGLFPRAK